MTDVTSAAPTMPQPVARWEKPVVALILLIAAALRLHGISSWLLANVDEVSALNQIGLPFLSGASTHSNYLLTTVLLKTVGWLLPFPYIRILTALTNVAALSATYWALRGVTVRAVAFMTLAALTLSWNVLYYSRIFECGSFDPSVACFFMACVLRWMRDRSQVRWLAGASLLLGFHFNTHALPCFYALAVFAVFLALQLRRRLLSFKGAVLAATAFGAGTIPYLYTAVAFPHFDSALGASYGTLSMEPTLQWAVNFRHPLYYLRTLTEYLTFYPLPEASLLLPGFALFCLLAVLAGVLATPPSPLKGYLVIMSFGLLVVIGLSPFPVYNEGHLHFFWPHFLALLSLLIYQSRRALRVVLALTGVSLVGLNLVWLPHILQNQVVAVEDVLARNLDHGETVYISDGAMLKLRWLDVYRTLESHPLVPFVCQGPEAMQPFSALKLGQKAVVIITSDGVWPPPSFTGRLNDVLLLSDEQLMEAYQSHGLRIYEITPQAAPP